MNPYEKRIIYEKAIRYYGEEHQLAKATEEIGELLTEIGRYMAGDGIPWLPGAHGAQKARGYRDGCRSGSRRRRMGGRACQDARKEIRA